MGNTPITFQMETSLHLSLCVLKTNNSKSRQTMAENRNRTALNKVSKQRMDTDENIVKHLKVLVESSLIRTKPTRFCTQISMRNHLDVPFQNLNAHTHTKNIFIFLLNVHLQYFLLLHFFFHFHT